MWKKSADTPPSPPPVGPPVTSSQAADAGRRFRRSPLLDEDEMAGLPSHAEGWTTLFDEFPRLLADVRRNAHIRADAELRGIRAYDADADAGAKKGAPYYSSRNLHRRDIVEPTTVDNVVPKVLQPGRNCKVLSPVFRIWIQPDPHVFGPPGSINERYGIRILLSSSKNSKENLDSYCFAPSFGLFPKCSIQVGGFLRIFACVSVLGNAFMYTGGVSYALFISLLMSKLFCRHGYWGGGGGGGPGTV
jgi:hypothetical protein